MRRLLGATVLVVAGVTVACGAPTDASAGDFCDAVGKVSRNATDYDRARDAAAELNDVGTPEGISGDARDGFEISMDAFDDSADEKELEQAQDDLSSDEKKKVEAFGSYIDKTCGSGGE